MNSFRRTLVAAGVLAFAGFVFAFVSCRDRKERTASSGRQEGVEPGAVPAAARPAQLAGTAGVELVSVGTASDKSDAVPARGERKVDESGASALVAVPPRSVEPGGVAGPADGERIARFTVFDQQELAGRLTELGAVGDLACQGDAASVRTLTAVADSGTSLSGEAVRMIGRVPAKSPEVVECLVRYAQTADFRVAAAALEALPGAVTESRALAVVSNVLAKCLAREYGSTNKVGSVCVFVGRDKIRDACLGVLASFRSKASFTIAEQELRAVERTVATEPDQLRYGSRLVALLRDIGDPEGAGVLEQYAERLRENRSLHAARGAEVESRAQDARLAAEALRVKRPGE